MNRSFIRYTALLLAALHATGLHAAIASEYEVKAAFIYNFTRFVQWPPARASGPLDICVMGEDPFGSAIDEAVAGKSVGERAINVTRIEAIKEAKACELLFISSSEEDALEDILEALGDAPVLTVADMDDFAERGGMINLIKEGSRVRFEINVDALEDAGLRASSRLLRLATIVGETK